MTLTMLCNYCSNIIKQGVDSIITIEYKRVYAGNSMVEVGNNSPKTYHMCSSCEKRMPKVRNK